MKKISLMLGMALMLACTVSAPATGEEIRLGGGGSPVANIINPVKGPFEKATGVKINHLNGSATFCFKSLYNGEIDATTAGIGFEGLLDAVKKEGFEVKDPASYKSLVIGKGVIHVIINKDNPVSTLSKEQVKGIFSGKISNWKEVGGKEGPIIVVISTVNPATKGSFKKLAMDDEPYVKDVLDAGPFEEVRQSVAANPEAIGFGPFSIIDPTVKAAQTPEFAREFILVTKGAPSPNVQKFIDFVKGEGQKYVIN